MEQRETKGLSKRVDAFLLAHLDHLALVPVLLYLATPLIDLAIVVANGYVYDDEREVYRTVVDLVAHPLGTCFAIVCALAVIRLMVRGYLRTSRCRLAAMVPFAIFLVLATCSTFANPDNPYRFTGIDPSYVGIGSYFLFVLVYFWPASLIRSERLTRMACIVMSAASIPVGIHALWFRATYGGLDGTELSHWPVGIFYNPNHYGYLLSMVVPLSAGLFFVGGRRLRVFSILAFLFNTYILIENKCRGAWFACALALVALCAFCIAKHREYLRRALMIFALFGLAICVVSIWNGAMIKRIATAWSDLLSIISGSDNAGGAGSGRWGLWVITADRISDRPWLGWGAEGICDGLLEPGNTERSHCEPLMYAAYFGIPAMVCYLAGVFATFVGAWRRRRTIDPTSVACACAAFSYFVSSCFGNMYFYTTPFFFILLGMALCRLESKGDATDILIGDRT